MIFKAYIAVLIFTGLVLVDCLNFVNNSPFKNLIERNFSAFKVWISCEERLPMLFNYKLNSTNGNLNRTSFFTYDPMVDRSCQQKSTAGYKFNYERGHMVPANHMDFSLVAIKESNYMTNILPQTIILNRQAWYFTEELTQCWKVYEDLDIIGGAIMGSNSSGDFYIESHGVRTPAYFWKVIHKLKSNEVIAWIMPNTDNALRKNVDNYLTSISEIEQQTGFVLNKFSKAQKNLKLKTSWTVPNNCKRS